MKKAESEGMPLSLSLLQLNVQLMKPNSSLKGRLSDMG